METSMIEVQNLTKQFGNFTAVSEVSFNVHPGETLALLGPNGSGKTTTLKCLIGLNAPTSGSIRVAGLDLVKQAREARQLMSYLPQRVSFNDNLTAREVMNFYCRLRRVPQRRVDELFATSAFHFNGFSNRPVGEFSGGMVQRLGLAVACLPDAPIMILDEPTASLDPEGAVQFREYLAALKQQGKTILFSSHMLGDVERLADRVGIMVGGRLRALDAIDSLRESLRSSARMRVTVSGEAEAFIKPALAAGAGEVRAEGTSLLITSRPEARLGIIKAIQAAGGNVERFATEEPSLEDFYLRYIHQVHP
jgi:Cu-processing system ATP-binding protein